MPRGTGTVHLIHMRIPNWDSQCSGEKGQHIPTQVWSTPRQECFSRAISNMHSHAFTSGAVGPNKSSRVNGILYIVALPGLVDLASLPLLACREMRVLSHHRCLFSWRPALVTQR